jgi:hypothetical protein
MYRAVLGSLVLFVVSGLFCRVEAKLIPYRKLTAEQRMELEASEQRMSTFDRTLQALESARKHGKISRKEYGYEAHDLTAYIAAEARFQNDILIDSRPVPPEDVREVMENIVKYGVVYPAMVIAYVAARIAPISGSYSFSP